MMELSGENRTTLQRAVHRLGPAAAKEILEEIALNFAVNVTDITGESQFQEFVIPRDLAIARLKEELDWPFSRIGRFLGDRDPSTIRRGYDRWKNKWSKQ